MQCRELRSAYAENGFAVARQLVARWWFTFPLFSGIFTPHMGVSKNRGTPKSYILIYFNRVFHYKPSILGYPFFPKHPYIAGSPFKRGKSERWWQLRYFLGIFTPNPWFHDEKFDGRAYFSNVPSGRSTPIISI